MLKSHFWQEIITHSQGVWNLPHKFNLYIIFTYFLGITNVLVWNDGTALIVFQIFIFFNLSIPLSSENFQFVIAMVFFTNQWSNSTYLVFSITWFVLFCLWFVVEINLFLCNSSLYLNSSYIRKTAIKKLVKPYIAFYLQWPLLLVYLGMTIVCVR